MRDKANGYLKYLITAVVLICQHVQLTYSASISIRYIIAVNLELQLLNIAIIAIPYLFFLVVTKKNNFSLFISSVIITILSLVNYHVFLYHGTPFLASDIYNIKTALNVLSSYQIVFDSIVFRLLIIAAFEIALIVLSSKFTRNYSDDHIARQPAMIGLLIDIFFIWLVFFSKWTIFPSSLVSWSWSKPMAKYGYEVCFTNSINTLLNKFNAVEGYDVNILESYISENNRDESTLKEGNYPDIILILNESLCDLDYCSDIPEGAEALKEIRNIPGIVEGYSTVPLIGGGTNCSEYELLTSNSFYQISVASPFSALDMEKSDNIAKYLKSLGYRTSAMHCFSDINYSRNEAYPAMGFDNVILGKENFIYGRNYNREWLDKDNYTDLLDFYGKADKAPQFIYLLTFQNHGGYEQNDSEQDSINIKDNFSQYTDDVNEYLSSIQLSSFAFNDLISELSESARPVIVLMVGDHAPSFISEIPVSKDNGSMEKSVIQRTVPYFVWTNTEINEQIFTKDSTLTDLIPMLLESAHMPLSLYYEYINELHIEVPIRTSDGIYIDKNGELVNTSENEQDYKTILNYYYMEYNTLSHGKDYLPQLFSVE